MKSKGFNYFIIGSPDGSVLYRSTTKHTNWVSLIPLTDYVTDEKSGDVYIRPATFLDVVKYLFTGR